MRGREKKRKKSSKHKKHKKNEIGADKVAANCPQSLSAVVP